MIRTLDILLALILVLILIIPFFLIAILAFFLVERRVFFSQTRIGKDEVPFQIYKFRTMKNLYDESGELLPDEERMTKFGKLLRTTSLDEIPGVFNVIIGNMSFVGPRPLLPEYLPFYNKFEKRRHEVLPGITGLAQINGRNSISWEDKFKFDIDYVENRTTYHNIKILISTLKVVLQKKGITPENEVAMPRLNIERQRAEN